MLTRESRGKRTGIRPCGNERQLEESAACLTCRLALQHLKVRPMVALCAAAVGTSTAATARRALARCNFNITWLRPYFKPNSVALRSGGGRFESGGSEAGTGAVVSGGYGAALGGRTSLEDVSPPGAGERHHDSGFSALQVVPPGVHPSLFSRAGGLLPVWRGIQQRECARLRVQVDSLAASL